MTERTIRLSLGRHEACVLVALLATILDSEHSPFTGHDMVVERAIIADIVKQLNGWLGLGFEA